MILKQYVVDTFTGKVFAGNPAAVCIIGKWLPEQLMQNIAKENNLSETAFAVKNGDFYDLRWFAPRGEIDLCGHATMGTAFVLFRSAEKNAGSISFRTKSGILKVKQTGGLYETDLPAYRLSPVTVTDEMAEAAGVRPVEAWMGRDLVCVLENEEQVIKSRPGKESLMKLDGLALHLTAKGEKYDCVTRSFAPKLGVAEDPVCGSGHCHVIPLWSAKSGKETFTAYQASERGGVLRCRMESGRVALSGEAVLHSESEIHV